MKCNVNIDYRGECNVNIDYWVKCNVNIDYRGECNVNIDYRVKCNVNKDYRGECNVNIDYRVKCNVNIDYRVKCNVKIININLIFRQNFYSLLKHTFSHIAGLYFERVLVKKRSPRKLIDSSCRICFGKCSNRKQTQHRICTNYYLLTFT